jgi:hypothetical protein
VLDRDVAEVDLVERPAGPERFAVLQIENRCLLAVDDRLSLDRRNDEPPSSTLIVLVVVLAGVSHPATNAAHSNAPRNAEIVRVRIAEGSAPPFIRSA